MPLDEAQKKRVQEYLDPQYKCLRCGQYEHYSADLAALPLDGTDKTLRILVVGCSKCGYIEFYSPKSRWSGTVSPHQHGRVGRGGVARRVRRTASRAHRTAS